MESANLRAQRDNLYLRTAVDGHESIDVICYYCFERLGKDPASTYAALPPFQGVYLAPAEQMCSSTVCNGRISTIVPTDITQRYELRYIQGHL
jgi:hypothetical protein